jgi:hypothetical protein
VSTQSAPFTFSPHSIPVPSLLVPPPKAVLGLPRRRPLVVLIGYGGGSRPTNRGGHLNQPNELSAQEWGKQQAARSPRWSEEKWQRIATVLGVCVARETPPDGTAGKDAT